VIVGSYKAVAGLKLILRWMNLLNRNVHITISRWIKNMTGKFPDKSFYRPEFSPWLGYGEFEQFYKLAGKSLIHRERCYFLYSLFLRTEKVLGDVAEAGVYQGGSAAMLAALTARCRPKQLHLFDTFKGIPDCNPEVDCHNIGDFSDTSLQAVKEKIGHQEIVVYHEGAIPATFIGMEGMVFSFVHVDVDVYPSYRDCLNFFWPRLSPLGVMVFDDYGHPSCLGARKAVDEFFADKQEKPMVLHQGQSFVIKGW